MIAFHNPIVGQFFMNRFRKLGFMKYNRGLQGHSSLLNMALPNAISVLVVGPTKHEIYRTSPDFRIRG